MCSQILLEHLRIADRGKNDEPHRPRVGRKNGLERDSGATALRR